jgi:hypothetical protein
MKLNYNKSESNSHKLNLLNNKNKFNNNLQDLSQIQSL